MENLRSYEISVWTLQDSFITVLKPSNLEFKGKIIDPLMVIKDDGENTLSLKIPMYIRDDSSKMIENPLWYNTRNGTIIADLRKLKVIFNKATTSEEVFEFLITNVKEEHEGFKKYCGIECEGLAFHELGKQGYKIALEGGDEIAIEQKKYFDGESEYTECPQPTINYWADRVFKGSNWHYSIQMDWSAHDGIIQGNGSRRNDKVYEDSFVSAWTYSEDKKELLPQTVTNEREKYRLVEAKESNRYNLSQTIAETFQVYCKYKYYYDDNYHIIDREVIFYNNFLNEAQGVIDLTYKYNTEHLTRIMDATDTVTKMYVRSLSDGDAPAGEALISDAAANKSKEDYLLNFDYLYNIGTITQEQHDEIEPYYAKLHKINERLIKINEELIIKENEKIKQEARKKTAEDAIALDTENISNNDAIARNVADDEGNINITADNAQMLYLIPDGDKGVYYCNFKHQGIVRNSIHLYWDRVQDKTTKKYNMVGEITTYNIENDEFGEVSKVVNINKTREQSWVYATFSYSPNTYFKKVSEIYGIRLGQDQAIVKDATKQIKDLETAISDLTDEQNDKLEQKAKIISDFERMMGPALREGQWQPEDEYSNYGEVHDGEEYSLAKDGELNDNLVSLGWDSELFDDEQDFHYRYGATLQDRYYPCIEITPALLNALTSGNYDITKFLAQLTLIYKNSETGTAQRIKQYIAINSKMKIAFLRNKTSKAVTPVLMITDAATMDSEQLALLQSTGYLAYISSNTTTGVISETVTYTNINWLIKPTEITNNKNYGIVYPRFKINSLYVKSPYTMVTVKRQERTNWEVLANYENFYILPRTSYYTVTIKPEAIFLSTNPLNFPLKYKIYFTISMSPLAIYLDAVQVLKENSFPKVSYEIDVMSVNKEFVYDDYSKLGQIAHINDYEFRFENTMGYISELDLDLDKPWQDKAVIKNYKTKFEDIFSTIVAQSEQMKKNSATIAMAANAFNSDGTLSSSILGESLMNAILTRAADNTTDGSVPSPATEFMKYDPLIRNELRQTYNEAGKVLAAASKSVEAVAALNLKNADILGSFQTDVLENMTPTVFKDDVNDKRHNESLNSYTEAFKPGDIWTRKDGSIYTAIQNSTNVQYATNEDKYTSTKGWAATKDGQLAISKISGAAINIDTEKGKIELIAGKTIQLICGGEIQLYSKDLTLTGEQNVVIGGPNVTIYSSDTAGNNTRGVHIFANKITDTSALQSAVDITGDGIEMRASKGIKMQSGGGISFSTSDGANTSAISIDKDKGIWLGGKEINLFSGDISTSSTRERASVRINKDEIYFGVANTTEGTAVDLTKDYIIFGTGPNVSSSNKTNIGSKGNSGVQITKDFIHLTTGDSNINSYIGMDKNGIVISNQNSSYSGGYVKISQSGVIIGTANSSGTVDTETDKNNIINNNAGRDVSGKGTFQVYAPNFVVNANGILYAHDANISGTIRATSGSIGGWQIDTDSIHTKDVDITSNNSGSVGLSSSTFTRTINDFSRSSLKFAIGSNFGVTSTGKLYASDVEISGAITAKSGYFGDGNYNITIGTSTVENNKFGNIHSSSKSSFTSNSNGFYLGTNGFALGTTSYIYYQDKYQYVSKFQVDSEGNLYVRGATISGNITADSGSIGGIRLHYNYGIYTNSKITADSPYTGFLIQKDGNIYLGPYSSQYLSCPFQVTSTGYLTARNGKIGGWNIDENSIYSGTKGNNSANNNITLMSGTDTFNRYVAGTSRSNLKFAIGSGFGVDNTGKLYASGAYIGGETTINTSKSVSITGDSLKIKSNIGDTGISILGTNPSSDEERSIQMQAAHDYNQSKILIYPNGVLISGGNVNNYISLRRMNDLEAIGRNYSYELAINTVSGGMGVNINGSGMLINGFRKLDGTDYYVLTYLPGGYELDLETGEQTETTNVGLDLSTDLISGGLL